MSSAGSVTKWIDKVKKGDEAAAQELWQKYVATMLEEARKKLKRAGGKGRVITESDIVQSAFNTLCRRARQGKLPKVTDRDSFLPLLIKIIERRAINAANRERRAKRGGGKVKGESAFDKADGGLAEKKVDPEPTPEMKVLFADALEKFLSGLGDDELREVALLREAGHTIAEIAQKIGRSERTVQEKLRVIKTKQKNFERKFGDRE